MSNSALGQINDQPSDLRPAQVRDTHNTQRDISPINDAFNRSQKTAEDRPTDRNKGVTVHVKSADIRISHAIPDIDAAAVGDDYVVKEPKLNEESVNESQNQSVDALLHGEENKLQQSNLIKKGKVVDGGISYNNLQSHMSENHPRDAGKPFGCCTDIGCFPCFCWSRRVLQEGHGGLRVEDDIIVVDVKEVNKEIGLGPTLFMMMTKALAYFFVLITIINLPIMWLYYSANVEETTDSRLLSVSVPNPLNRFLAAEDEASQDDVSSFQNFLDTIDKLSIGNLGRLTNGCNKVDLNAAEQPFLSCAMGTMTASETTVSVGYIGNIETICDSDLTEDGVLNADCNGKGLFTDDGWTELMAALEACDQEGTCTLPSNLFDDSNLSADCQKADIETALQSIIVSLPCSKEEYVVQAGSLSWTVERDTLGLYIVFFDLATCLLGILFVVVVGRRQGEYIEEFKQQQIEMSDFTIRVQNLPNDLEYGDNEHVLRAKLWEHFQILAAIGHDEKQKEEKAAEGEEHKYESQDHCRDPSFHCKYEIADICFGRQQISETSILMELHPYYKDVVTYEHKLEACKTDKEKETTKYYLDQYEDLFQQRLEAAREKLGNSVVEEKGNASNAQVLPAGDSNALVETEEKKDASKTASSKEDLYKSFNISHVHQPVLSKSESHHSIRFAYITFRNIENAEHVLRAMNIRSGQRFFTNYFSCDCLCPEARERIKSRRFYNRWLDCNLACEPDEIMWENLGVSDTVKPIRFCLIYLTFVVLLIGSLLGLLKTQAVQKEFTTDPDEFDINYICPDIVTKDNAEQLFYDSPSQNGPMSCYCSAQLSAMGFDALDILFVNPETNEEEKICGNWFKSFVAQSAITYGAPFIVLVINILASELFIFLTHFEAPFTFVELTRSQFRKILALQFININIVLTLVNMNLKNTTIEAVSEKFLKVFGILDGEYAAFSSKFYTLIGVQFCMTMVYNIFTPHISKFFAEPSIKMIFRCCDRGCRLRTKYDPSDPKDDRVHTSKHLQSELNALYTGPQIQSSFVYAQLFTTLLCCLTFSAGMPVLYPIAAVFYIVHYLVYHNLFLRFYAKTVQFNEQLPQESLGVVYAAIVLHLFFGTFMFSNEALIPPVAADALGSSVQGLTSSSSLEGENFSTFTYSLHSILYTAVLLLAIGLPILYELLHVLFERIWAVLTSCCSVEYEIQTQSTEFTSGRFFKELSISALKKSSIRLSQELKDFQEHGRAWMTDPKYLPGGARTITDDQIACYEARLKDRLGHVHEAIDDHMELLLRTTKKRDPVQYKMFMKKNHKAKLEVLMQADNLKYLHRCIGKGIGADNRRLRIKGTTQSYALTDSPAFEKAQVMEKVLQERGSSLN